MWAIPLVEEDVEKWEHLRFTGWNINWFNYLTNKWRPPVNLTRQSSPFSNSTLRYIPLKTLAHVHKGNDHGKSIQNNK